MFSYRRIRLAFCGLRIQTEQRYEPYVLPTQQQSSSASGEMIITAADTQITSTTGLVLRKS